MLSAGCHPYRSDLDDICHVFERSGHSAKEGFGASAPWLEGRLRTERARDMFRQVAANGALQKFREELDAEARAQGLSSCPTLDIVRPTVTIPVERAPQREQASLSIAIDRQGRIFWKGVPVDDAEYTQHLDREVREHPDVRAVIAADVAVPYARVVQVIDLLKKHGIQKFALAVDVDGGF